MTHITCRLTAKNRDQLRNPTLGSRVWATFTYLYCLGSAVLSDSAQGQLENSRQVELEAAGMVKLAKTPVAQPSQQESKGKLRCVFVDCLQYCVYSEARHRYLTSGYWYCLHSIMHCMVYAAVRLCLSVCSIWPLHATVASLLH